MKITEALEVLKNYNLRIKGDKDIGKIDPIKMGMAIDIVQCEFKNLNLAVVSVCTCPMESTDVYDDDGTYLGYVCLGCGYFSKY